MLQELDEDEVADVEAIDELRGRVATAFADWRVKWGYGMAAKTNAAQRRGLRSP